MRIQQWSGDDVGGQYYPDENVIVIFDNQENIKTHEVMHALGNLGTGIADGKLSEGYTELFNPNHRKDVYPNERMMVIILEQIYGKDFMRKAYANQSLFNDIYSRFNIDKTDDNQHWNLIRDVNSFLIKYQSKDIRTLQGDPGVKEDTDRIIQRLKDEYKTVTGKEWDDNEVLKLCYDRITGEETSDKYEGFGIIDIYFDENGDYAFEQARSITRLTKEDNKPKSPDEMIHTSLSGETYRISKESKIDER